MASWDQSVRELHRAMDFTLRVGEMLLSNGAGAADVTVTMQALAHHLNIPHHDIDVTFTSLRMTVQYDPDEPVLIHLRNVKQRDIDYEDLTQVDHLVRDVLGGVLDLREARSQLGRILSSGHQRRRWAVTIGWGVMCAGVGVQLGGSLLVVLVALIAAMSIDRLQLVMSRRRIPFFYQQVMGGAVATFLAALASALPVDVDPSVVVTANIIMLLAGVGFMGALQDALSGFYITAGARILEAMLATAGIIAGVSAGLSLAGALGLDLGHLEPARVGIEGITASALGAAIAAAAFAYSSYSPKRILAPIGLIAGLAMVLHTAVVLGDLGRTWGAAVGAFAIGLVSYSVAGRMRVPPLVVVVSAIVPMLPGLSIYRGLALMAEGGRQTSAGLIAMITAASVAIALASGVILGEYVAQPLKREARRLENRLSGPRLVGPARIRPSRAERRRMREESLRAEAHGESGEPGAPPNSD